MKKNPLLQGSEMHSGLWIPAAADTHIPQCSEREKTEVSRLLHFLKEITAVGVMTIV